MLIRDLLKETGGMKCQCSVIRFVLACSFFFSPSLKHFENKDITIRYGQQFGVFLFNSSRFYTKPGFTCNGT